MSDKSRSDDAMTVGQLIEKLREYDPDRLVRRRLRRALHC
jgi:hypothetical protein